MSLQRPRPGSLRLVHRASFWLGLFLVATKAVYLGAPRAYGMDALTEHFRSLLAISYADVLFACAVWVGALAVLLLLRPFPALSRIAGAVAIVFAASAAVLVFTKVVGVGFFGAVGGFLTYPMLQMVGDVRMMRSSIGAHMTPAVAMALVLGPLAYLAAVWLTHRLSRPASPPYRWPALVVLCSLVWVLAGRDAYWAEWSTRQDRRIAENAHWVLVSSWWRGGQPLARLADDFGAAELEDFAPIGVRPEPPAPMAARPPVHARVAATTGEAPLNVILIVLESVATRWTTLGGLGYATTPTLAAEAERAVVFENFYAHVGRSSNSLAAILLSAYPKLGFRDLTDEHPDLPGTSLASLFRARGYRTAFMTPSALTWARWDEFLAPRGFDEIRDEHDLVCGEPISSWGLEDRCVVDELVRWLEGAPPQPFFLMAWTQQTHHPYEPSPDAPVLALAREQVVDADAFARYLNVLHETDRQLARLFDAIRRTGRENNTLVVITGDHGQAFGFPHASYMQGRTIYEEDVRVPLLLWMPRSYRAERAATIGGHIDLAPTIADLAGLPPDPSWLGRSLFSASRPPRAYFYVADDEFMLGVREDRWKYILNLRDGVEELYDLTADADEQHNVAAAHPDICAQLRRRLAAWTDANRRRYEIAPASASAPAATPNDTVRPDASVPAGAG